MCSCGRILWTPCNTFIHWEFHAANPNMFFRRFKMFQSCGILLPVPIFTQSFLQLALLCVCVYVFPLVEGVLGLPSKVFHCGPKLVVLGCFGCFYYCCGTCHSGRADISEFATVENIWCILIYYDFIPPEKELIFGQWNVQVRNTQPQVVAVSHFLDDLTRRSLTIFYRAHFRVAWFAVVKTHAGGIWSSKSLTPADFPILH